MWLYYILLAVMLYVHAAAVAGAELTFGAIAGGSGGRVRSIGERVVWLGGENNRRSR